MPVVFDPEAETTYADQLLAEKELNAAALPGYRGSFHPREIFRDSDHCRSLAHDAAHCFHTSTKHCARNFDVRLCNLYRAHFLFPLSLALDHSEHQPLDNRYSLVVRPHSSGTDVHYRRSLTQTPGSAAPACALVALKLEVNNVRAWRIDRRCACSGHSRE